MIKIHLDFSSANENELSTFFAIPKVAGAIDNLSQLQDGSTLNLTITKELITSQDNCFNVDNDNDSIEQ